MNKEQRELVESLSQELAEGNLAIFAGAGLSVSAGFVDWKKLLKPVADELDLDVEKETDLVTLAQYHVNSHGSNRSVLNQQLINSFPAATKPTPNHEILARLPISTYWTTNYDLLIESALKDVGKVVDTKRTHKNLAQTVNRRDAIVYKMHGDVENVSEAVLIRDDYERYQTERGAFLDTLKGDLISKTFLFLGFSFTDPNLDYILSRVRVAFGPDQRRSFCLMRKVTRTDKEKKADFEYRQRKQVLFAAELMRFHVKVVYVDEFRDITTILAALAMRYRRRSVFFSGSAHTYAPQTQAEAEGFLKQLAKDTSARGYRVISGFGLGVGNQVIAGVIEETMMAGIRLDDERLVVRPFPQGEPSQVKKLWTRYRKDMIDHSGVAIFAFGNKLEDSKVVDSDGMDEEFELALAAGVFVIPIGVTGSKSKKLWDKTMATFDPASYPNGKAIKKMMARLGDDTITLNEVRKTVLELVEMAQEVA